MYKPFLSILKKYIPDNNIDHCPAASVKVDPEN